MKKIEIGRVSLELVVGDITVQDTDAVVNAANTRLAPGGGVAGAIHRAAGPGLWEECKQIGGIQTGEAVLTKGYDLLAEYVIHTVGPVYHGRSADAVLLASCYRACLQLADSKGLNSIAFPALSTGIFGYPVDEAAEIALGTVVTALKDLSMVKLVRFVLFDESVLQIHIRQLDGIINKE
jgi:O-acetyl-ADP-ribose deacetylase (regulator of RNase III)